MQVIVSLVIVGIALGIVLLMYHKQNKNRPKVKEHVFNRPEEVLDAVSKRVVDYVGNLHEATLNSDTSADFRKIYERVRRVENALHTCVFGIPAAKTIVKSLIREFIQEDFKTFEDLSRVFNFDPIAMTNHTRFECLLQRLSATHGLDSMRYLIGKYGWDQVRYNIEDGTVPSYNVSVDELIEAYQLELLEPLTYEEALKVAATLIYEDFKGMGIIDTLREQNIDGFNIGASGAIMSAGVDKNGDKWGATRSVWIFYQGKYIHLQFLEFESENDVRRVVQLLARYNNPGPLTEKRGYLVTTMYDKSRVLALRPYASEYWAVFVRKFVLSSHTLEFLIDPILKDPMTGEPLVDSQGKPKHKYKNADLPLNTIKMLMRGEVTTGFTGRQGCGKTTMMVGALSQADARYNIRVIEMTPEMYLREVYPQRNILSLSETPTVGTDELQDALKKSDAAISIVGEVATNSIAARMIQMGQVASIFTVFSHHANRTVDLVHALTNSIVADSGGAATPATVEPQVTDVVKVDVHLNADVRGNKYVERVTEIIPLDAMPYPERCKDESLEEYSVRLNKEYYTRQTDRVTFRTQDILVFNPRTFSYDVARDKDGKPIFFSANLTRHILSRVATEEVDEWRDFINRFWGDDIIRNQRGAG